MKTVEIDSHKLCGSETCGIVVIWYREIVNGEVSKELKTASTLVSNVIFNNIGVALFKEGKTWHRDWRSNWGVPFNG